MSSRFPQVTGVILAGGRARRMGGKDKGLVKVAGKPLIAYVIEALQQQLNHILINANRNQATYSEYGLPVIADMHEGYNGPLEGMVSCMKAAQTEFILTAPCDSPRLPGDYVQRMFLAREASGTPISVADDGERIQPVFSLLSCELLESLLDYLDSGQRKIDTWFAQHSMTRVDFSDKPETFVNLNTPGDVRDIENSMKQ